MQAPHHQAYYQQPQYAQQQQQQQQQTQPKMSAYARQAQHEEHGFNSANWEAERVRLGLDHLQVQDSARQASVSPQQYYQQPSVQSGNKKRAARAYHSDQHVPPQQPQPQAGGGQFATPSMLQGGPDPVAAAQDAQAQAFQDQQRAAAEAYHAANPPLPAQAQPQRVDPRYDGNVHGNISQPLHHIGAHRPQGPSKIDADLIPSPVYVNWLDQDRLTTLSQGTNVYPTCSGDPVPLPSTDYVALDQGNCSPRYMRSSTYIYPATDDMAQAASFPLGLVIQPFAEPRPGEHPVPLADFTALGGPPRCNDCRAYINVWCHFIQGGQKFVCNLCGSGDNDVPPAYFSHLDTTTGRRLDYQDRPELACGSVDFVVPEEYYVQPTSAEISAHADTLAGGSSSGLGRSTASAKQGSMMSASERYDEAARQLSRTPEPLNVVFAIDVSWTAGRSGMLREVLHGIRQLLYGNDHEEEGEQQERTEEEVDGEGHPTPPKSKLPLGAKVAIFTYDRTVHFYNLKAGLEQPQMLVVPDLDDMFSPIADGLLVDPFESRIVIERLLETLETTFAESSVIDAALGAAVKGASIALKNTGGQVNLFHTSLPGLGPGAIRPRQEAQLYNTEKERTLFASQDPFYRQIGEELADAGIGCNLFLFPSQYIDVASLGVLTGITGGELYFHPRFDPVREGRKLRSEIVGAVSRETAYSVTMRVRCSNGLRVADHFGNFFQRNMTDLEFGTLDADKAVAAVIKHDGKLSENQTVHFQCAVLYTSSTGQRRVRCHNLALGVSTKLGDVFRVADMGATISIVAKEAITQTLTKSLKDVRETMTDACVKTLFAYRKWCAGQTSPGQLILPESYKLFPIYALGLMKTKALKGGSVASDVRTYYMRLIKSIGVGSMLELVYPSFYPLHNMEAHDCQRNAEGRFMMPSRVRCSYARMEAHGAYLIENGETAILWLGAAVSPALLQDLYGVDDLQELDNRMTTLPKLPTHLSMQVRNLLEELESRQRHRRFNLLISRQGRDGTEMEFANMLAEDSNNDGPSYPDFLAVCHSHIQQTLAGEKRDQEVENSHLWRSVF